MEVSVHKIITIHVALSNAEKSIILSETGITPYILFSFENIIQEI